VTYKPPEEGKTLRFRASAAFKEQVDDCVRLWKLHAAARGEDVDAVDMSHFIRSTLSTAMDAEFEQYGGRPKTPEAWSKVESAIKTAVKTSKK
jgi:hypothetical protein